MPAPTPAPRATSAQLAGGLIETVLVVDGRPVRLAEHLARLNRSSRELFGTAIDPGTAERAGRAVAGGAARAALRLRVGPEHPVAITVAAIGPAPAPGAAVTVHRPAGLWRHKWAERSALVAIEAAAAPAWPLFVAADGTVLETSRGNVFLIQDGGALVTAPLRDDLLPGVTRAALLELACAAGRPVEIRPFDVAELGRSAAFWTSSLSGAVAIRSVDGIDLPRADAAIARLATAVLNPNVPLC